MARPAIRITLIDRLGKRGCHRGHRVGESFDFDTAVSYTHLMICFSVSIRIWLSHHPLP